MKAHHISKTQPNFNPQNNVCMQWKLICSSLNLKYVYVQQMLHIKILNFTYEVPWVYENAKAILLILLHIKSLNII